MNKTPSQIPTLPRAPTPTILPNDPSICAATEITLDAGVDPNTGNPYLLYFWESTPPSPPLFTQMVSVGPAVWCVTVVDSTGCQGQACVTVSTSPGPVVSITPPNPVYCRGSSCIPLDAGSFAPGATFLWAPDGETTPTICVGPLVQTTYTVTVTEPGQCEGVGTITVLVEVPPTVPGTLLVQDLDTCAKGIRLDWPGVTFNNFPAQDGVINIYRSTTGCSTNPVDLLVMGLAGNLISYIDLDTVVNTECYFYTVQAEDSSTTQGCIPGPNNAGATTTICFATCVTDLASPNPTPPLDQINDAFRAPAKTVGVPMSVGFDWAGAKALQTATNHYELYRTWDPTDVIDLPAKVNLLIDDIFGTSVTDPNADGPLPANFWVRRFRPIARKHDGTNAQRARPGQGSAVSVVPAFSLKASTSAFSVRPLTICTALTPFARTPRAVSTLGTMPSVRRPSSRSVLARPAVNCCKQLEGSSASR